jgi:hypothetical protein
MALSTLFFATADLTMPESNVRTVFNQMFDAVLVERVEIEKKDKAYVKVHMFQDRAASSAAKQFYSELQSSKTGTLDVYASLETTWEVSVFKAKNTVEYKSLCIPFAHVSTSERDVRQAFNALFDVDAVEKVVFKDKVNEQGISYYTIFIHMFQDAKPTEDAALFYADIAAKDAEKGFIKVRTGFRDFFWKVFLNKAPVKPVVPVETPVVTPVEAPVEALVEAPLKSVCIPRAMKNTTQDDIKKVFDKVFGGDFVERVDIKAKTDTKGEEYVSAFVHFNQECKSTDASNKFYAELYAKDAAKDHVKVLTGVRNYFWKVVPNKAAVRIGAPVITVDDEVAFDAWRKAKEAFEEKRDPEYKEAEAEAEAFRKSKEGTPEEGKWWENGAEAEKTKEELLEEGEINQ